MKFSVAASILLLSAEYSAANKFPSTLAKRALLQNMLLDELPSTGEQWMTMENGMEFQPAGNLSPLAEYHLRQLTSKKSEKLAYDAYPYRKPYVDGAETYYDEYAQAWRALGFYIDCDYDGDDRRRLQDDGAGCQRFLLWAAYVDEGYEGNGVHEYKYYDRKSGKWSDKACYMSNDQGRDPNYDYSNTTVSQYASRCVKMDCHLKDTHFSLLGYFKEPNYGEWMEQLFKHEGDCVWTDGEFQFMQENRDSWPEECTASDYYDENNNVLYYDVKPEQYGSMSFGVYTDSKCITEYTGSKYTADMIIDDDDDNDGGESLTLTQKLRLWNDAFDVFKQCQPCKAYMLTDIVAGIGYESDPNNRYQQDNYQNYEDNNRRLQDDDDDGNFRCHDAAGYDSVNQCMKFKTKTRMVSASMGDVLLAGGQGTITQVEVVLTTKEYEGTKKMSPKFASSMGYSLQDKKKAKRLVILNSIMVGFSAIAFLAGLVRYFKIKSEAKEAAISTPLVQSLGETA